MYSFAEVLDDFLSFFFGGFLSLVVGDYINVRKTTFGLNFYLYQAYKQHDTQKHGNIKRRGQSKKLLLNYL